MSPTSVHNAVPSSELHSWRGISFYSKVLIAFFVLSLPLVNPWVRGDGVGYYAFARAILIEHKLDFMNDWLHANTSFRMGRVDSQGRIRADQYTPTGHIDNHFSIGPALLWSPFLVAAHVGVLLWDTAGGRIAADGFSAPYRVSMALGTAIYGFLSLWLSFLFARRYVPERWAFWATIGIWFGSSLPVYMYFNPSWSHALSAFCVALFLLEWDLTRDSRSWAQWIVLGVIGGLMMDVYYISVVLFMIPLIYFLREVWTRWSASDESTVASLTAKNVAFACAVFVAFSPTLIVKKVLYGSYFNFGYGVPWYWKSPAFWKVCFSAEHGLFAWTPIVLLGVAGLLFVKRDRLLAFALFLTFWTYVYVMGCYSDWAGVSSFGNRFFVSLTPIFVVGLGAFLQSLTSLIDRWKPISFSAARISCGLVLVFIVWNAGLVFQWGTHLIPARGAISFRSAAYNQFAVVPGQAAQSLETYLTHRQSMMKQIETEDTRSLENGRALKAGSTGEDSQ